ncbi:MAG: DUF2652 domain-containing protein [Ignavibacteriae bacterium]|nr:DUF2652 domain-containing protein [Ignavibacteriota bacterium]NOG97926.1 DUF2652 domain-containing protein [Ignavibacteriota bacterium]
MNSEYKVIETETSEAAIQPALILIPDISGFTEYMKNSDLIHCRYIIAELLEVILDSNILGLSVSELEGDAVLFYKFGKPPSLEDTISQCNHIFKNFHSYIKQFNADKLCDCVCCNSSSELSIKFVVHYGKVSPVKIKSHEKLFGSDVILAHRLLKSNIKIHEYIIFSKTYLMTQGKSELKKIIDWNKIEKSEVEFKHLGAVEYYFLDMSILKDKIIHEPRLMPIKHNSSTIKYKIYIDTPPDFVRTIITNFKFKPNWITVLQEIHFNEKTIPRIGAIHKCLMSDIFFKTILIDYQSVSINESRTIYIEKLSNSPAGLEMYLTYNLKAKGLGTLLSLELDFVNKRFYSTLLKHFLRRRASGNKIKSSLKKLKSLCEEIHNKFEGDSPTGGST